MKQVNEEETAFQPTKKEEIKDFSEDELKIAWRKLIQKAKEDGLLLLCNAIEIGEPIKGLNYEVKYITLNELQVRLIKEHETQLLSYLKNELQNSSIRLTILTEEKEEKNTFQMLTNKEKFNIMAEKNIALIEFQRKFYLDFEV